MARIQLDISLSGLGALIKSGSLSVPRYQRAYAWKDEHTGALFDDIAAALEAGEEEYFLGSVVLAGASAGFEVVDGQQRLATTVILAAAIRDYFLSANDNDRADTVATDYLAQKDRRSLDLEARFRLNDIDHPFFQDWILTPPGKRSESSPNPSRESHRRLLRAYQAAQAKVTAIAESSGTYAADKLLDWTDFIDKRLKVIEVKVPDDANAFTIFETLNDRGLGLAISDLLKNFLFSQAHDRIDQVQAAWIAMQSALEAVSEDDVEVTVSFIRHLWSYQHGLTARGGSRFFAHVDQHEQVAGRGRRHAGTRARSANIMA